MRCVTLDDVCKWYEMQGRMNGRVQGGLWEAATAVFRVLEAPV